jgi:hypothetical protein
LPEDVQGDAEPVPGGRAVALGPQVGHHPVAREPAPFARQEREQGQAVPLDRTSRDDDPVIVRQDGLPEQREGGHIALSGS